MCISKACWRSFLDWLEGGAKGTPPTTLRLTLGPVWWFLPQARQAAEALGPWLVSLLEARQRARLAHDARRETLEQDVLTRPLTRAEARQIGASWGSWRLEAELLRLVRLVEAPGHWLFRPDWPHWEVRYWALVITLARIAQQYAALARQPGGNPAERLLASAETVWKQAACAEPVTV
ncbi:MAG TPA: hypothetical protein VKT82_03870 [Ktedonobacterales bacterium]|nr:hypothetical protein [Ktedonobacterales bacterium]